MRQSQTHSRGFTLIELMVTLSIAAVLMVVAVPSLTAYKRNAELTSATNTLLAALNAARGEAMKRGMNTMVVPTDNGTDWKTGWVVFVDQDRTQTYDASADVTVLSQSPLPGYFTASGTGTAKANPPYVMFDASGYSKLKNAGFSSLTFTLARSDLSGTEQTEQTRLIVIAKTGRARTCKPSTDTTCTADADK
jgi:type IV fimbrial biogenesis protein FimT